MVRTITEGDIALCNRALVRIRQNPVLETRKTLNDTVAGRLVNVAYNSILGMLCSSYDWNCCTSFVKLKGTSVPTITVPADDNAGIAEHTEINADVPASYFFYSYQYPLDFIDIETTPSTVYRIRNIYPYEEDTDSQEIATEDFPQEYTWTTNYSVSELPQNKSLKPPFVINSKAILCDAPRIIVRYIEVPPLIEATPFFFQAALELQVAYHFSLTLTNDMQLYSVLLQLANGAVEEAKVQDTKMGKIDPRRPIITIDDI